MLKNKKGQPAMILLAFFFIILVLIFVGSFSKLHQSLLVANYNFNTERTNLNSFHILKEAVLNCYGNPIKLDKDLCDEVKKINFQFRSFDSGYCSNSFIFTNGDSSMNSQSTLLTYEYDGIICPLILDIFFEVK